MTNHPDLMSRFCMKIKLTEENTPKKYEFNRDVAWARIFSSMSQHYINSRYANTKTLHYQRNKAKHNCIYIHNQLNMNEN